MFSVIMPTYNCEKYVEEAINSVLNQTYSDFELIIVDDGSIDSTASIVRSIAQTDSRVKFFENEHGGVSAARNRGIEEAKGKYILFIDGDDTWNPKLLEECGSAIKENDGILIFDIARTVYSLDGSVKVLENPLPETDEITEFFLNGDLNRFFTAHNIASPCNKTYKLQIIKEKGIRFSEKCCYLEDLKFNFEYLKYIQTVKFLSKNLYNYRLFDYENQVFKRNFQGLFVNADSVYDSAMSFLNSKGKQLDPTTQMLCLILRSAYHKELFAHLKGKDSKESKKVLSTLNKNKKYCYLLKKSGDKFSKIIRLLKITPFKKTQIKLIKARG